MALSVGRPYKTKDGSMRRQIIGRQQEFEDAGFNLDEWEVESHTNRKGQEKISIRGPVDEIEEVLDAVVEYNESQKPVPPESMKEWMMALGLDQAEFFAEVLETWDLKKKFTVRDLRVQMGVVQREAKMVWRLMANDGWVSQDERLTRDALSGAQEILEMMEILEEKPKKRRKK